MSFKKQLRPTMDDNILQPPVPARIATWLQRYPTISWNETWSSNIHRGSWWKSSRWCWTSQPAWTCHMAMWATSHLLDVQFVANHSNKQTIQYDTIWVTYLPHKAVAEVFKDKEPIGRECAGFNWFENELMSDSSEVRFKWFGCELIWDSNDFGCQLIWDSVDFGCQLIWDSSDLVVNRCALQMILVVCWFELQVMWLSLDLRFKWFGCQSMCASYDFGCLLFWTSSDVVVNWFEIQVVWMSNDLRFKWFGCQLMCDANDFVKRSFCARLPSKLKLWRSKTKFFCETSFKNEAVQLKNEAFLRDFLQKWSFEAQKRSFRARLPSKMTLWRSKTKHFCETSFKNETLKLKTKHFCETSFKNESSEAQKQSFSARFPSKMTLWKSKTKHFCETSFKNETLKRSNSARLPAKMNLWRSKTKLFCETSFKNGMLTGHLTSEFQYVLTIFKWMLQKYCACHEKVEPRHTKSCNCHAKGSLQSNTSVTWNVQPFHGFSVGGFKHRQHKARNHCACHAKRIVSDPLQIPHACQRFCNPHELLRLPRILQRVEIPAPATQNTLWTSKNVPRPSIFDFQIALARRPGANFAKVNFQKCSEHATF